MPGLNGEPTDWETSHQDMVAYLNSGAANGDTFLTSLRDWVTSRGYLSERQEAAVLRNMQRTGQAPGTPEGVSPDRAAFATFEDCPSIPNGSFYFSRDGYEVQYQIYTVTRGSLNGQRILKRRTESGMWKGFGTLRSDGSLYIWRRFAGDHSERYIQWAEVFVKGLRTTAPADRDPMWTSEGITFEDLETMHEYRIKGDQACRRCNNHIDFSETAMERSSGLHVRCAPSYLTADDIATSSIVERNSDQQMRPPRRRPARRIGAGYTEPTPTATPVVLMSEIDPTWER